MPEILLKNKPGAATTATGLINGHDRCLLIIPGEEKQVLRTFGEDYLLVAPNDRIDEFDLFGWGL